MSSAVDKYERYIVKEKIELIKQKETGEITLSYFDGVCLNDIVSYLKKNKIVHAISIHGKQYLIKFDKRGV